VATAGFQFVQGRDFDLAQYPTDSMGVILNESAAKAMHFTKPIGQIVSYDVSKWHVVGVIRDFILRSPYSPTRPMVIYSSGGYFNTLLIKLNGARSTADNLQKTEAIFKKYNPIYPFEYHFIDEDYAKKFEDEQRTGTLTALFAGLTIFISCLGLFGLATYMAENRIKEIGVRKVLGASVTGLATMLSRDFLKLVFISLVIATPIAWTAMYIWLQGYAYRVGIKWWVFAAAGLLSIAIAVLTVSFQAIRAAVANPIKSLRTE
jgi:putative ABC transport system permease protein